VPETQVFLGSVEFGGLEFQVGFQLLLLIVQLLQAVQFFLRSGNESRIAAARRDHSAVGSGGQRGQHLLGSGKQVGKTGWHRETSSSSSIQVVGLGLLGARPPQVRGLYNIFCASSADVRRPSADVCQPSADVCRPSADVCRPSANVCGLSADVRGLSADVRRPSADVRGPSADVRQRSGNVRRLPAGLPGDGGCRDSAKNERLKKPGSGCILLSAHSCFVFLLPGLSQDMEVAVFPHSGQGGGGRPVRESRTPVNLALSLSKG